MAISCRASKQAGQSIPIDVRNLCQCLDVHFALLHVKSSLRTPPVQVTSIRSATLMRETPREVELRAPCPFHAHRQLRAFDGCACRPEWLYSVPPTSASAAVSCPPVNRPRCRRGEPSTAIATRSASEMSESMQHSNSHDEDGRPQSCPSYTETSILDEAIPFIIFTSKQSTVEDELSAADAEALEARLEALQDRQSAQRSLISTLEIRLNEVRARLDEANRPRQALSISRLRPRSAQNAQELEAQCARLQAKRDEVEEAVTATQAEVQSVQDSVRLSCPSCMHSQSSDSL